jgi:hypothetical protein
MNKIISTLALLAVVFCANAQSTAPRFGTAANKDNTARVLTYAYVTGTDGVGADTLKTSPSNFETYYRISNVVDSTGISITSTAQSYAGDNIIVIASGSSGGFIKFIGSNWLSTGKATLSANGRAVIRFVFDGSKWVEASRQVQ